MPQTQAQTRPQSVSERLSPQDAAEATLVAQRLADELRALIAKLPEADRSASAMSRALEMDRVTCQRIVGAIGKAEAEAATLVQLPGTQGLRQFVLAMRKRRGAKGYAEQLAAADAAIDRFDALLQRLGGSQRQLRARILAEPVIGAGPAPRSDVSAREALFAAAASVTGRWSRALVDVRIVRPVADNERLTEGWRVRGYIGHASRPEALPLEMYGSTPLQQHPDGPSLIPLHSPAPSDGAGSLLPSFCSLPLPRIISRSAGDRVFQLVEPDPASAGTPIDIVAANRTSHPDAHPGTMRPAVGEMWSVQMFPAQRLLFDVFLHRDIARRCIPSLEVHLRSDDAHPLGSRRWSTRFPGAHRLEVLGSPETPAYPRHAELLRHVFTTAGLHLDEFVGYRCEVEYPIWRAGYCMVFDFEGNELPQ